jgi:spoIIIJ-associated protein
VSEEISVEATGETVGEAKWSAIRELEQLIPGLDREAVRLQVVSEGERGLLGVGFTPARVIATATGAPRTALAVGEADGDHSPQAAAVLEMLRLAAAAIGVSANARVDESPDGILATLSGTDTGVLIGRHGQTLDALQYLANAISHGVAGDERLQVTVDAGGYRERRSATLEGIGRRAAERASATGQRVALEPMTAVERKVVHESLKDDPEVETASEGTEPHRYVVIVPRRTGI